MHATVKTPNILEGQMLKDFPTFLGLSRSKNLLLSPFLHVHQMITKLGNYNSTQ